MNILITGIDGFMGRNLRFHLDQRLGAKILPFRNGDSFAILESRVRKADIIF